MIATLIAVDWRFVSRDDGGVDIQFYVNAENDEAQIEIAAFDSVGAANALALQIALADTLAPKAMVFSHRRGLQVAPSSIIKKILVLPPGNGYLRFTVLIDDPEDYFEGQTDIGEFDSVDEANAFASKLHAVFASSGLPAPELVLAPTKAV